MSYFKNNIEVFLLPIIKEKFNSQIPFSAHDITTKARLVYPTYSILHEDVREYVHDWMENSNWDSEDKNNYIYYSPPKIPGVSSDPESSWVEEYSYLQNSEVFILVTDNSIYLFDQFPFSEYRNLVNATSAGKYFNDYIRNNYTYHKISR
jgi:hypothetical protein